MKSLLIFLLTLATTSLIGQSECLTDPYTCPNNTALCLDLGIGCDAPTSVGHVYKPDHCRSPMKRLLNRTARFHDMVNFKMDGDPRYCQMLKMATDLNISIMKNPASIWGYRTDDWWDNSCEMACEINQAYDCAGLRRPIIEFSTPEYISIDMNAYTLCNDIKDIFASEIAGEGLTDFYETQTTFDISRIIYDDTNPPAWNDWGYCSAPLCGVPDISRLEARMYFFYLAKRFIDCGYRAVNLAQVGVYTKNDLDFLNLDGLIQKMKQYALDTNGKKLIVVGGPEILKVGNKFLLDYVESPMRPVEVTAPNANWPNDLPVCQDGLAAYMPLDYYDDPPWNTTCHDPLDPSVTGESSEGCTGTMPIIYRLDNTSGTIGPSSPGTCYQTYGMDEATWWSNLSEECQKDFFEYYYCNLPGLDDKRFIEIPISIPANSDVPNSDPWMLTDNPDVDDDLYDIILGISQPGDMVANVTEIFEAPINGEYCHIIFERVVINGQICKLIKGRQEHQLKYLLSFDNIDCSSTYGWSIKKPDGSWVGYQEGTEYELVPDQTGTYKIIAQQHNGAFQNGSVTEDIFLEVENLISCSPEYTQIELICPPCLSISSNVASSTVLVEVHEDYNQSPNNTFDIFVRNISGNVVKTIGDVPVMSEEIQIDVFDLESGVYYIQTDLCNDLNLRFVKI